MAHLDPAVFKDQLVQELVARKEFRDHKEFKVQQDQRVRFLDQLVLLGLRDQVDLLALVDLPE